MVRTRSQVRTELLQRALLCVWNAYLEPKLAYDIGRAEITFEDHWEGLGAEEDLRFAEHLYKELEECNINYRRHQSLCDPAGYAAWRSLHNLPALS